MTGARRLFYFFAVAIVTMMSASARAGGDFFFKPYVGAEYQYAVIDYGTVGGVDAAELLADVLNGGAVYLGARVSDHLGFEFGYGRMTGESSTTASSTLTTSEQMESFTADLIGYYPLGKAKKFELIGSAGLARTKAEVDMALFYSAGGSVAGQVSRHMTEIRPRLGVGAQYELMEGWNVRGMLRWQDSDFDGLLNDAYIFSLGMNYNF